MIKQIVHWEEGTKRSEALSCETACVRVDMLCLSGFEALVC